MPDDWFVQLARARSLLGLSQAELAARSHVSVASIKAYEVGARHPSRPYLIALLDVLEVDRGWRNAILDAAGFASDWERTRPQDLDSGWMFTPEEAAAEMQTCTWPAFVHSERAEVIAVNAVAERLWDIDFVRDYPDPVARNFLSVASDPQFADRVLNWDQAMTEIVFTFKNFHRGPETFDSPTPYFAAVPDAAERHPRG